MNIVDHLAAKDMLDTFLSNWWRPKESYKES